MSFRDHYRIGCMMGADTPGPATTPSGSPARDRAWSALHKLEAETGHPRWLGYAERSGAGTTHRSDEEPTDWYGTVTDDPTLTYATYFDTHANPIEPVEEFAGTIQVKPDPAGAIRDDHDRSATTAKVGAGLGLGLIAMIAIAKHR